jgi:hypothetical protein
LIDILAVSHVTLIYSAIYFIIILSALDFSKLIKTFKLYLAGFYAKNSNPRSIMLKLSVHMCLRELILAAGVYTFKP